MIFLVHFLYSSDIVYIEVYFSWPPAGKRFLNEANSERKKRNFYTVSGFADWHKTKKKSQLFQRTTTGATETRNIHEPQQEQKKNTQNLLGFFLFGND